MSQATGIDATWVRIGFVLLAIASGVMVFVYAMAWLLIPMEGESANIYSRAVSDRKGIRTIAAILIPLLIAVQFITSSLHVPFIGFIGWPTFLAVGVVVLIWRNADESEKAFIDHDVVPLLGADTHGKGRRWLIARVVVGRAHRSGRHRPAGRGPHHGRRAPARSAAPPWSSRRASSSSAPGG